MIEFYNAVFIPSTKAFLLQLGNHSAALLPLPTLTMPGTPLRMGSNPYSLATPPPPDRAAINRCLSPAGKVFVSPMRQPGQQVSDKPPLMPSSSLPCLLPLIMVRQSFASSCCLEFFKCHLWPHVACWQGASCVHAAGISATNCFCLPQEYGVTTLSCADLSVTCVFPVTE